MKFRFSLGVVFLWFFFLPAVAQQPKKIPRIAYLAYTNNPLADAFRQGLHELGYIDANRS